MMQKKKRALLWASFLPLFCFTAAFGQNHRADSLLRLLPRIKSVDGQIAVYDQLAAVYRLAKPDSCIYFADKTILLAREANLKDKEAFAVYRKGLAFRNKGDLAKGLHFYQESMALAEEAGDKTLIARNMGSIGSIYFALRNYEIALVYDRRSLVYFERLQNKERIAVMLNNIAEIHLANHNYDSALFYSNKALLIAEAENIDTSAEIWADIGLAYVGKGKTYEAKAAFIKSLVLAEEFNDTYVISATNNDLAKLYFAADNLDSAFLYAEASKNAAEKSNMKQKMYNAYLSLSLVLESTKKYEEALKYKNLYILYKDSVESEGAGSSLKVFEYEKSQKEIALLKAEQANKDQELKNGRFLLYIGGFGLIVALGFGFFVFISRKKIQKAGKTLKETHDQLQTANEELLQTHEKVLSQRDLLGNKNILLAEYARKISKSMEAAKMTQKAILPSKQKMQAMFPEHFILFKPRDVVSGDFWWAHENIGGYKFLILADCTGHGVPGAMLSMIGSSLLDRIIRFLGVLAPADILEQLHLEIKTALQQEDNNGNEGMDIAIVRWERSENITEIIFSGSKRPLYYIDVRSPEGSLIKINGSRKAIGGMRDSRAEFEQHQLELPPGSSLYLCSDGLIDQNNYKGLKFSEKAFIRQIAASAKLTMPEQKKALEEVYNAHTGNEEQRDDILVIGLRL